VTAASWGLPPETILEALEVDRARGLSHSEAQRRLRTYGPNRLRETRPRTAARMLWDQLASPIVALLAAATGVALLFEEHLEALAIAAVLGVNTAIGFWTERRAVRSMEALRDLGKALVTVRRDASASVVPAEALVPGDIVLLEAGDVLTGDLRIVLASRLQVDEAALTGESLPVDKSLDAIAGEAALPDRTCMLYKGTSITRGSAEGVVVATGMQTELGGISRLVEEAEPEITPLEARLARLGRRLILLTLAIATFVAGISWWAGHELYLSIELALALAVAAVPEGLPIVATVALARGMWRMARRNALVERLSAVETLGSTSLILADKTGTLTENSMAVAELVLSDGRSVTLPPGAETPAFLHEGEPIEPATWPALIRMLRIAALCNNAELARQGSGEAWGDPTEVALLVAAHAAGVDRARLLETLPELREVAFDSETKRMATLHRDGEDVLAAVKGAPETVLPCCSQRIDTAGQHVPLEAGERVEWLERAEALAARGQRVLGLALRNEVDPAAFDYASLTWLGLVGMLDPPRVGVRGAIDACQDAGIRVVMVTGDHRGTAEFIATATGLIEPDEVGIPALDARSIPSFENLSESDQRALLRTPVIARATPKQKLELITLFQRHGDVVAMTGDGVNDAPALKKADIGVAMGQRGTQVAREAADMVLQDDELGTIVEAVAQGRAIFANIRKFVLYLMSCNMSEILAVAAASLAQGPLPLLPLQILFLNLVTDVFPALALGVGEGSPGLMRQRPRASDEALIARRHWGRIFGFGSVIALTVLAALLLATLAGKSSREATTISFLTLALAQLWHVFNFREPGTGLWRNEITGNPWIWGALVLCLALIGLAVHWPALSGVLSVTPPGLDGWALALGMSSVPLIGGQIQLALSRPDERSDAGISGR
jgi:Ca2+-transporting ATPase